MLEALILGIIQGITEFIPVSSSGHLVLVPELFGWTQQSTSFDVVLHGGTLLALLIFYRKFLINTALDLREKDSQKLVWQILIAAIPAGIIGVLFEDKIDSLFKDLDIVIAMLIIVGLIMIVVDYYYVARSPKREELGYKDALSVGISQPLALIRGTSRSGITIIAGILSGLNLKSAVNFSFLIGIPLIGGAFAVSLLELLTTPNNENILHLAIGFFASFTTGYVAIKFMLSQINSLGLKWFGLYRIILGIVILLVK